MIRLLYLNDLFDNVPFGAVNPELGHRAYTQPVEVLPACPVFPDFVFNTEPHPDNVLDFRIHGFKFSFHGLVDLEIFGTFREELLEGCILNQDPFRAALEDDNPFLPFNSYDFLLKDKTNTYYRGKKSLDRDENNGSKENDNCSFFAGVVDLVQHKIISLIFCNGPVQEEGFF